MDISFFCNLALVYGNRHMEISNFSYNRELGVVKITLFFFIVLSWGISSICHLFNIIIFM